MSHANALRLLLLAAIWGASFLFMRIAAPSLGALWVAEIRVVIAAAVIAAAALWLRRPLAMGRYWRHYLVLGFFNSALPFFLIAFASRHLTASLLAVLNSTVPLFAAVLTAIHDRRLPAVSAMSGLLVGAIGVAIIAGFDPQMAAGAPLGALAAALAASCAYGLAALIGRSLQRERDPVSSALGSLCASIVLLTPALPLATVPGDPDALAIGAALALGVLCTGIAFLIFFRLIAEIGPTSALTVTFLIPLFGILWGALFLGEPVGWHTLGGGILVLLGTALVTGAFARRQALVDGPAQPATDAAAEATRRSRTQPARPDRPARFRRPKGRRS